MGVKGTLGGGRKGEERGRQGKVVCGWRAQLRCGVGVGVREAEAGERGKIVVGGGGEGEKSCGRVVESGKLCVCMGGGVRGMREEGWGRQC